MTPREVQKLDSLNLVNMMVYIWKLINLQV